MTAGGLRMSAMRELPVALLCRSRMALRRRANRHDHPARLASSKRDVRVVTIRRD
jgi:hypothetical protein